MNFDLQKHLREKITSLPVDARLFVGYSGGSDSATLLHALSTIKQARQRGLMAININHQIHEDSDKWARICEENAKRWGVDYKSVRVDVVLDGRGIESAARDARYGVFEKVFGENDYLLTAHHMQDQAETFLMRALRASSVDGLASMREQRDLGLGKLFRPMLGVDKSIVNEYIKTHNIEIVSDPSNMDNSLDRCFIRNEVMPLLEKRWPRASSGLATSAKHSQEASDILSKEEENILNDVWDGDTKRMDVGKLFSLTNKDNKRVKRVMAKWVKECLGESVGGKKLDEMLGLSKGVIKSNDSKAKIDLGGGELRFWGEGIYFIDKNKSSLGVDGTEHQSGYSVTFKKDNNKLKLKGRNHRQSFKNVMQEIKVPPWERESVIIVKNNDGEVVRIGEYWKCDGYSLNKNNEKPMKKKKPGP